MASLLKVECSRFVSFFQRVAIAVFSVLPLFCITSACSEESDTTDKYAMVEFLSDAAGDGCTIEQVDQLGIAKSQCDIRHSSAVSTCSNVTLKDSPVRLDRRGRARATLVFSFCMGVELQAKPFEIDKWEPTITSLLE